LALPKFFAGATFWVLPHFWDILGHPTWTRRNPAPQKCTIRLGECKRKTKTGMAWVSPGLHFEPTDCEVGIHGAEAIRQFFGDEGIEVIFSGEVQMVDGQSGESVHLP
jgi:hypothetical protein